MSTASQVFETPPVPPVPVSEKTNKSVIAGFVIGLVVLLPSLFILCLNIFGTRLQFLSGMNFALIRSLLSLDSGMLGLLGLFIGVIGFVQMVSKPGRRQYFLSITGMTLCFCAFFYLLVQIVISYSNLLANFLFRS